MSSGEVISLTLTPNNKSQGQRSMCPGQGLVRVGVVLVRIRVGIKIRIRVVVRFKIRVEVIGRIRSIRKSIMVRIEGLGGGVGGGG